MAFFDTSSSKLFLAQFDFTSFTTSLTGIPGERQLDQVTTWADAGDKFIPGLESPVASWEGFFEDTALTGEDVAFDDLKTAAATGRVLSFLPHGDIIERVVYSSGAVLYVVHSNVSRIGNAVVATADININGTVDRGKSLGPKHTSAIVADTNGTIIDDGSASAAGGVLTVHVFTFTATGGNAQWIMRLQMDTVVGFGTPTDAVTATFTAVGAQRVTFTGTFEQFVRIQFDLDATSGSLIAFASYVRN